MPVIEKHNLIYEEYGIGVRNESPLHFSIKEWYSEPGDRFEVKVDGNVIDIVRGKLLIEIQTRNFKAMENKLMKLLQNHRITLVYPIAEEKWITTTNEHGEVIRRRKSPQKGSVIDVFSELVSIPTLINSENLTLEVLLICEEELRRDDGKGSWRRKGISKIHRNLIAVKDRVIFREKQDFIRFLPEALPEEFTNKDLAEMLKVPVEKTRKATYCLKKMDLITECGKRGRELLFRINE